MFSIPGAKPTPPETPEELFYTLKRDTSIPHLWAQQGEVLKAYQDHHLNAENVAFELPTGCGKTLIGMLVAEWRRRKFHQKVIYLCPTRQLASQVADQANRYGIEVAKLVGKKANWPSHETAAYHAAEKIVVSTYSALFNVYPEFDDADIVILDDAHASENYISSMWSLLIRKSVNEPTFNAVVTLLRDAITPSMYASIRNTTTGAWDRNAVQLVPLPQYYEKIDELRSLLDSMCTEGDLKWRWIAVRENIEACLCYITPDRILFRPYIPPTLTHQPFARPAQRIFMSATLGEGGDLERFTGIRKIDRIEAPQTWRNRVTGRRFIIFAARMLGAESEDDILIDLARKSNRTLVLTEDNRSVDSIRAEFGKQKISTFGASDVEDSLDPFTTSAGPSALVLANRYDGIDLAGNSCRQMALVGTPTSGDLQEQFLLQRFQATSLLRDRIRTRVTQGVGRCTRSEADFAAVLMFGEDLYAWCVKPTNLATLKPELQAEILLGVEQSKNNDLKGIVSLLQEFQNQTDVWGQANSYIISETQRISMAEDPVSETLRATVALEVDACYRLWASDVSKSFELATRVSDQMDRMADLKPYRTLWSYFAATMAFVEYKKSRNLDWVAHYKNSLHKAAMSCLAVSWFVAMKRLLSDAGEALEDQIEVDSGKVLSLLETWGQQGPRFEQKLGEAQAQINSNDALQFEMGLEVLGKMLGADSYRWNPARERGAPDGFWLFASGESIIWEAKSDADPDVPVTLDYARQAGGHETWIRGWREDIDLSKAITIYATPQKAIREEAESHCRVLNHLSLDEVRAFFRRVSEVLIEVRSQCRALSDERSNELIASTYEEARLGPSQIKEDLGKKLLSQLPKVR